MAKCFRMALFSLIAVGLMAGFALAQSTDPTTSQVEIAACEVADAGYFHEADDNTLDTKKMGTICYTLGQNYNVNDRIVWTLSTDSGATTYQDAGEYFMVTQRDDSAAPLAWSCNVFGDVQGITLLKAWNAQAIPTGKGLAQIEFRAIGGSGSGWVRRGGIMQSAFAGGVKWCLAHECEVTATTAAPVFPQHNNIAVDTSALGGQGCCNRYYITETSYQWLITGGYIEFDKKPDQTAKKIWVMGSKRQFVGTKSYTGDLFDEEIYCPDRRYFAGGGDCDTYTKIICGTTTECGQTRCAWDNPAMEITNVYTLADTDIITMTVQATAQAGLDTCVEPSLTGDFSSYSGQCGKTADGFYCYVTGQQVKAECPSFPNVDCYVQMQLCTNGTCQMGPRWFKNIKDEFLMTGGTAHQLWDITPVAANQYAGIWVVNGTQFIVPYLTSISGYGTNCFLNSKSVSETYIWVDIFAMQSCDSPLVTDACFAKLLPVTNIPVGSLAANGQKRFDFTNTSLVPYSRNAGNTGEVADAAKTFNFVAANGVAAQDRFAALVTVCNLDQFVGWKQMGNYGWDLYTNDFPGQFGRTGDLAPNSSLSCTQSQGSGVGGKRTLPVLTPLGQVWKQ